MIYILLAIALLGILTYAISRGSRVSTNSLTSDKARIAANEIIDYAQTVAGVVQALRLRGCSETQISFESSETGSDYTNAGAPSDNSCHVFNMGGGKLNWLSSTSDSANGISGFSGNYKITNIGDADKAELIYVYAPVSKETCININQKLGITNPDDEPPSNDTVGTAIKFTGSYDDAGAIIVGNNGEETVFAGKTAACFDGPPAGFYYFYQVLLAR